MIWFTSDFHIDDTRMLPNRKIFSSLTEMEETIVHNFNERVKDTDTVWLLGDIAGDVERALRILKQLNGKKNYIIGNHDRKWIQDNMVKSFFQEIYDLTVIQIDGVPITLCHYPMYEWYRSKYGGVLIHGHMHNEKIDLPFYTNFNAIDVSVEKNNYYPISWDEIKDNIQTVGKQLYAGRK